MDVSKSKKGTSYGICGLRRRENLNRSLREYITVMQAEMAALEMCTRKLIRETMRTIYIQICSDSQAFIKALGHSEPTLCLVREVKDFSKELTRVIIISIPGQSR